MHEEAYRKEFAGDHAKYLVAEHRRIRKQLEDNEIDDKRFTNLYKSVNGEMNVSIYELNRERFSFQTKKKK